MFGRSKRGPRGARAHSFVLPGEEEITLYSLPALTGRPVARQDELDLGAPQTEQRSRFYHSIKITPGPWSRQRRRWSYAQAVALAWMFQRFEGIIFPSDPGASLIPRGAAARRTPWARCRLAMFEVACSKCQRYGRLRVDLRSVRRLLPAQPRDPERAPCRGILPILGCLGAGALRTSSGASVIVHYRYLLPETHPQRPPGYRPYLALKAARS